MAKSFHRQGPLIINYADMRAHSRAPDKYTHISITPICLVFCRVAYHARVGRPYYNSSQTAFYHRQYRLEWAPRRVDLGYLVDPSGPDPPSITNGGVHNLSADLMPSSDCIVLGNPCDSPIYPSPTRIINLHSPYAGKMDELPR